MQSNVSPPADKPTLTTLPQEVKNIIYSLLLPSGEMLKRIKPSKCPKTAAWNAFAVICVDASRLNTAILRVILKDSGHHKLTVDLSGVSSERIIGVHFLLAKEQTGVQYTEVGTAETTLSSVTTRFVHPPIRKAFSILSGLPRSLLTLPMRCGHPEALWHINETHPWVMRSLIAMLRLYYEDEENSELLSKVWAEHEPSEEELATVTHWGFVGGVLEDGQAGDD
ncbi:hypothetical protein LTR91_003415 [Friedmanniomyces endolithicus]|uniref:Uncharacterized protein n=1 Tax=Friedmanniomyces endolithicus TaxID=329885 RepID=A0AAN6KW51_9PEZI|nr:hypothetical protein LTR59_007702 [Friedmanniomyces endolithicus]KAK0923450.1 hypothetical protein LTR57_006906 [Friedmanniomyces endolithicus]KAK0960658.1 hypothetical protein LTS01_020777 [Friedmanniomyces endolithicus]KAK1007206.1 hypothetical protein LTR91_003415 [Friedmanniomyces endolithicus]KAK1041275.1 hypothetical protein LTS16_009652 [Friedmanniomyces endolithicus]